MLRLLALLRGQMCRRVPHPRPLPELGTVVLNRSRPARFCAGRGPPFFATPVTTPLLFHSRSLKITSAFYSSVVISGMIRHATRLAPDPPPPLFPCQLSSKSPIPKLLRTLFALSRATARSKPCVFSCLRTLCRHNGGVGGYDPVENSRVSPANYQLSTVDFPAVPLATISYPVCRLAVP